MIQKKIQELSLEVGNPTQETKEQLLRTIRIPRNLHYLTDKLPRPNYGNESDAKSNYTLGNSPSNVREPQKRTKSIKRNNSKSSLPQIRQIIRSSHSPQLLQKKKGRNKGGDGLMIQGKSKIIEEAKGHDRNNKNL